MESKFIKSDSHRGTSEKNQDRFFVSVRKNDLFAIVADGVGGHSHGEVAAEMIIENLKRFYYTADDFPGKMADSIEDASENMRSVNRDMATTIVLVYLKRGAKKHKLFYTWAGDSRLFLVSGNRRKIEKGAVLRERAENNMYILTEDDTVPWKYFFDKKISVDEITQYPGRSRLYFSIPRDGDRMGDRIMSVDVEDGDTIFLCTDGLWELFEKQSDLLDQVIKMSSGETGIFKSIINEGIRSRPRVDNSAFVMIKIDKELFEIQYEKSFD
ncbi:MAG: protein phosphatase 2C domain-containing protein [Acidobacteriota bacterium]